MPFFNDMVKGTIILTAAGILSRFLGFYNRIFLSNLIGAKELGIYQLIFPVYMVGFSICCSGVQVTLSKMISSLYIQERQREIRILMRASLLFSLSLSLALLALMYCLAPQISIYLIREASCISCLRIALFSLPFVAMKSCLHGYYLGLKQSAVSAGSQLFEQTARVGSIYLLSVLIFSDSPSAVLASCGMLTGEAVSFFYTLLCFLHSRSKYQKCSAKSSLDSNKAPYLNRAAASHSKKGRSASLSLLRELITDSIPLCANRLSLTLLQSLEAILIPGMLQIYYKDSTLSLELYGILTGMALPFLFFPATLTNSLSVMLLPTIAAAKTKRDAKTLSRTASKSIHFCISVGIMSAFLFLLYGKELGNIVFSNATAGEILFMLSLLCPFLYISSCLSSILNGLGYAASVLWHNLISICIRISFILFVIPLVGIKGYMWGLLASYIALLFLDLMKSVSLVSITFSARNTILFPCFFSLSACLISDTIYRQSLRNFEIPNWLALSAACAVFAAICLSYFLGSEAYLRKFSIS